MSTFRNGVLVLVFCLVAFTVGALAGEFTSIDDVSAIPDELWDLLDARRETQRLAVNERMEKATVWVVAFKDGVMRGTGSGFVVGEGMVMTNQHVVKNPSYTYYIVNQHLPVMKTELAAEGDFGAYSDYALLQFTPPEGVDIPVLSFSTDLKRLDRVFAWGYPGMVYEKDAVTRSFNLDSNENVPSVVVTEGVINTVIQGAKEHQVIIHTANISPGNSGGPLVNERGEVVGINTHMFVESEIAKSTNNAIYAEHLVAFMRDVGVEPQLASAPDAGGGKVWWRTSSDSIVRTDELVEELTTEVILRRAEEGDPEMQLLAAKKYYHDEEGFDDDNDEEAARLLLNLLNTRPTPDAVAYYGMTLLAQSQDTAPRGVELMTHAADSSVINQADPIYINHLVHTLYHSESYHLPFNRAETVKWAILAAEKGGPRGKAMLAAVLVFAMGGEQSIQRARELAVAALNEEDVPMARAVLAFLILESGDAKQARAMAMIAAEDGSGLAQGLLSRMYRLGDGAPQDWDLAYQWGQRAVMTADPYGLAVMARYHAAGDENSRDFVSAWVCMYYAINKVPLINEFKAFMSELEGAMTEDEMRRARALAEQWRTNWGSSEERAEEGEETDEAEAPEESAE